MKHILFTIFFTIAFFTLAQAQNIANNNNLNQKIMYSITINGIITSETNSFLKSSVKKAEKVNALLIINLDTPGGVLDATRSIVQTILTSKIPIIVHVTPAGARAASAGIFLALAANYTVMDEGTNIGAAHPVSSNGKNIQGEMNKKITNDTLALVRAIAEKRNKNIKDAEKMVSQSLSFTASEALKKNLINVVLHGDIDIITVLASKYHLPDDIKIVNIKRSVGQKFLGFLADPNILASLFFLGIIFIGLEFKIPGTFIFATLGTICMVLFGIGANMIPINYLGAVLILVGLAFLIAEVFVTSFGILALCGLISLFFGMHMLFKQGENMGIDVSLWLIIIILVILLIIILLVGRLIVKDFKRRPASGMETMINKKAKIIEWSKTKGKITINGEIWDAISSQELKKGDEVFIESYNDMTMRVKK